MPGVAGDPKPEQYLQTKKIPQLFQSLTIALLYNQPADHINYLLECLAEVRRLGPDQVLWDTFLPPNRPPSSAFYGNHSHQPAQPSKLHGTMVAGSRE